MKIFPADSKAARPVRKPDEALSKEGKIPKKKNTGPVKKEMSASEIKNKLAAHVETSDAAKNMSIMKNSKKLGDGFMSESAMVEVKAPVLEVKEDDSEEIKTPNTKDLTLKSDIAQNDPKDTNTQEKLKTILSKGAFSFNPKEKEALEKILAG